MRNPIELLNHLISTPSPSRQEEETAEMLSYYLHSNGIDAQRFRNNVWAMSQNYDPKKSTLLLCAHHDTVKPSPAYTRDPFTPVIEGDHLYGLGSNDDGASLVGLIETFLTFNDKDLPFNLLLALAAEEEVTGENGMRALLKHWEGQGIKPDMGIVGEPTGMNAAIGERGLVVLDCLARAKGGHAAVETRENALYRAIDDINDLRTLRFPAESPTLGPIKVTVTQIEAGRQHNVVPEECRFVVDVRTTDVMTNEETVDFIRDQIFSEATPRSTRIRASVIAEEHPLVRAAVKAGAETFVSPTTSDMCTMPDIPTLKIGIGRSERSHTPDEFVLISEINEGIERYKQIIENLAELI